MFSENKKELVLKGFVERVQNWWGGNLIEITDKRTTNGLRGGIQRLEFKFTKAFEPEIPFERGDDVLIRIYIRNGKHGDKT